MSCRAFHRRKAFSFKLLRALAERALSSPAGGSSRAEALYCSSHHKTPYSPTKDPIAATSARIPNTEKSRISAVSRTIGSHRSYERGDPQYNPYRNPLSRHTLFTLQPPNGRKPARMYAARTAALVVYSGLCTDRCVAPI
eukprot:756845-Prymnesium_polylepis.2